MKTGNFLKVALFIIVVLTSDYGLADTWYVRPGGGSYGSENGTSYANAWDGFSRIVWGASGVKAGDTLYVCGTHLGHYNNMTVGASGASGSPITIRGDYSEAPGVIDGSMDIKTGQAANWTETSAGSNKWRYSNGYSNYVLINDKFCKRVENLNDMDTAGEWYYSNPYIYIYSAGNPADNATYSTIRVGWYGNEYGIKVDAHDYITIQALTFRRIESRLAVYGETDGAILIKNSKYCSVKNNHIIQCARGIMIAGASDYCAVDNNFIEKSFAYLANCYWYAFPIFSVANDATISNNTIDGLITFYDDTTLRAGSGIELETQNYSDYYCHNAQVYGNEVRYVGWWGIRCEQYNTGCGIININVHIFENYIHDSTQSNGSGEEDGIAFGCMAGDADNHFTGINAYRNIIVNFSNSGIIVCNYFDGAYIFDNLIVHCGFDGAGGILLTSVLKSCDIYNNTLYDNWSDGIVCYGAYSGGSGININNNIISKVTYSQPGHGKAVFISSTAAPYVSGGNNCFYDIAGSPDTLNFSNVDGVNSDPLFVSISDGNYHLDDNSPCINAGIDVGLDCDLDNYPFTGNPTIGCYVKNSLIGWWRFDSDATDSSSNGNNATLINNPSYVTGVLGNALSFSQVGSQYASVPDDASFDYANGATVAAWLKVNSMPTGQYELDGLWADIDSVGKNGINALINKYGKIYFSVADANGSTVLYSSTALQTSQWYHVACTYDNAIMKIYVNGVLDGSVACTRVITDNTRLKLIGKASWGAYYLDGCLDDLRVYGRAINELEAWTLANP